jgi:hypothetical protein
VPHFEETRCLVTSGTGSRLRKHKISGIEIEVRLRPTIAAADLEQLPLSNEFADGHRLEVERLWLASAPCLVPVLPVHMGQRKAIGMITR